MICPPLQKSKYFFAFLNKLENFTLNQQCRQEKRKARDCHVDNVCPADVETPFYNSDNEVALPGVDFSRCEGNHHHHHGRDKN